MLRWRRIGRIEDRALEKPVAHAAEGPPPRRRPAIRPLYRRFPRFPTTIGIGTAAGGGVKVGWYTAGSPAWLADGHHHVAFYPRERHISLPLMIDGTVRKNQPSSICGWLTFTNAFECPADTNVHEVPNWARFKSLL